MFTINHPNRRFIRHYVEMVIVMFAGMIVLGLPERQFRFAEVDAGGTARRSCPLDSRRRTPCPP